MALTGDAFHQRKKPGFRNQGGRAADSTKNPAALPSAYAADRSSTNGVTQTVTLKPRAVSSCTMARGSGNLTGSNTRSPYAADHRSSISSTLRGRPRATISRAYASTSAWVTLEK